VFLGQELESEKENVVVVKRDKRGEMKHEIGALIGEYKKKKGYDTCY